MYISKNLSKFSKSLHIYTLEVPLSNSDGKYSQAFLSADHEQHLTKSFILYFQRFYFEFQQLYDQWQEPKDLNTHYPFVSWRSCRDLKKP